MSQKMDEEFKAFSTQSGLEPPRRLTEAILAHVRADLNPPGLHVFSKLMAIHALTAIVTLSICPQFGFRLFGQGMGLMDVFMAFGPHGCMVACGAFFTGASLWIAALVLRTEEIRKIRRNRLLSLGALTLVSLGFFIMIDAEILLGLTITWLLGAFLGSWLTLELGWFLRLRWDFRRV